MPVLKSLALVALLALPVAAPPVAALAETAAQPARITVTAEGRADVRPDLATITLGVTTRADTAAAALAENSARLSAVLARLRGAGIAERDLQTSGLSLGPQFDYSRDGQAPRLVGYEAGNMLTVRVRALDTLGTILDMAVGDGANTFHGLSFGLAEPGPALDAARADAVAEARRRAGLIAAAAGVRLGAVIEITEGGGHVQPMAMARMSAPMAEASVPVAEGEVSYAASVTIVWALVAAD
jgi:uncharacterized protein YggE